MRATRQGQRKSCQVFTNVGLIVLLPSQRYIRLNHIANHWYSLVVIQKSRTSPRNVLSCTFVRQERDGALVWLSRGLSAHRPRSRRFWVRYFLDCLSRVCLRAPHSFPYFGAYYSSGSGPLRDSDFALFSFVGRLVYSLPLYLSRPPSTGTPRPCLSGPSRDCSNP